MVRELKIEQHYPGPPEPDRSFLSRQHLPWLASTNPFIQ
jgi:hypothetical protein